jgi:hypothetical protein
MTTQIQGALAAQEAVFDSMRRLLILERDLTRDLAVPVLAPQDRRELETEYARLARSVFGELRPDREFTAGWN